MKRLVNIGDRFGRLTVIGEERPPGSKRTIWICKCDCGGEKKTNDLRHNNKCVLSCGCLFRETHGKELVDISGQTFGRTKVLHKTRTNDQGKWLWKCKCNCGNIHEALASSLKQKLIQSCGCQKAEKAKERSGEKHWNWQGGITPEQVKARNSQEFILWRKEVFERDNFTCCVCKNRGGILNAHHLESFHICKDLRYKVDNGVTLCHCCHIDFHRKYGKLNNTAKQFEEYKNQTGHG